MTTLCAARVMRSALIAAAALAVAAGSAALASPGCDAVNAKAFDGGEVFFRPFSKTVSEFSIGDRISFNMRCPSGQCGSSGLIWSLTSGNGTVLSDDKERKGALYTASGGAELVYTVLGTEHDTTLRFFMFSISAIQLHSTCRPAGTEAK
jgi:hypothetical protein